MATKTKEKASSPPVEYASGQSGPKGLSPQAQAAKPQDAGETRDRAQSATGAGRGMDKLRDEMAKNGGRYVQVVGEYMTAYLLQHPEAEAAILTEGKTLAGSLKVMEAEARKVKTGNVAVLDDQTAFGIVLQYYGLNAGAVSKNGENVSKTGEKVTAEAGASSVTADAVPPFPEGKAFGETGKAAAPDLFDLDALLGVM
jgi:hypothetical protein